VGVDENGIYVRGKAGRRIRADCLVSDFAVL
jgi:hypothetical protein